jgi:hypothetical protein
MKTFIKIFGIILVACVFSSCSGISHVIDDDVYVTKSPILTSAEALDDESSYDNYRYRRDNEISRTRFVRNNRFSSSFIIVPYNYGGLYSPFYDPFYYPYNCGLMYGNSMCNPYYDGFGYNSFYYNNNFCYNSMYMNSNYYYGYGILNNNPYYNPYNQNNTFHNGNSSNLGSVNIINKPRNSIGGINNARRTSSGGMTAIMPNTNSSTTYSSSKGRNVMDKTEVRTSNDTKSSRNSDVKSNSVRSKEISSGTGLSRNGVNVSSSSVKRNSDSNISNTRTNTTTIPSNSRIYKNEGSSTIRNSGSGNSGGSTIRSGGSGSSTPRSGGSSGGGGSNSGRRGN